MVEWQTVKVFDIENLGQPGKTVQSGWVLDFSSVLFRDVLEYIAATSGVKSILGTYVDCQCPGQPACLCSLVLVFVFLSIIEYVDRQ